MKLKIDKSILESLDEDYRINIAKKFNFRKNGKILFYHEKSEFSFGRHKSNQLSYVYKCHPCYLEWCMLNAKGVIFSERLINVFSNENIFCLDSLEKLIVVSSNSSLTLDLRSCKLNENGFPISDKIEEKPPHIFSDEALEADLEKIRNAKTNPPKPEIFAMGNDWNNSYKSPLYQNSNSVSIRILKK